MAQNSHPAPAAHADRVREAAESRSGAAASALVASWRRSLKRYGLEPDTRRAPDLMTQQSLKDARLPMEQLLRVASPSLDRLFGSVGEAGCCVLMTNADGVIVERRGMAGDDAAFRSWGLWEGADWSEAREGTNGIGTCLAEKRPVTIHQDQHFHSRNTAMSCIDAPIYDHQGMLAAALDVSSCRADLTGAFSQLIAATVSDTARRIESDNFRAHFEGARIVMGERHGRAGAVLLAIDSDDVVIGATRAARIEFGLGDAPTLEPRPAADVLSGTPAQSDLAAAERAELRRAILRANGNMSEAARALGVGRATLYRRMNRLGIDLDRLN